MVKRVLATRPYHDPATAYLHEFSKETIAMAREQRDIHITDLEGPKATRTNFEGSISKENPSLLFLNGHGDKLRVAGHKDETILDSSNITLTKGKIVYALSCDSLEELGDLAVKEGAKAYIGYRARFMFITDPSRTSAPSKDNNALPFKRACVALINSLILGLEVKEAIKQTKKEYIHSIRSYGNSETEPYGDAPLIRFALSWDLTFLDFVGEETASL